MRFLLRWQHVAPGTQLAGRRGVRQAVAQLGGFEAPAASWERDLLRARVEDYGPNWLDELCLAGEVAWGRLAPPRAATNGQDAARSAREAARMSRATKVTPVTVASRADLAMLLAAARADGRQLREPAAGAAAEILALLRERGALFFDELASGTRRLASDVEEGLRELIAAGLVASDGFRGLRDLTRRSARRARRGRYLGSGRYAGGGPAGRWALLRPGEHDPADRDEFAEELAQLLLRRYGVVFRDVVAAESFTVPWRDLLRALRRLEARGLVRGGRFVSGFVGEQFSLPEALEALRSVRRSPRTGERVRLSAADPLNLTGVILPGPRIPAVQDRSLELVDGALAEPPAEGLLAPGADLASIAEGTRTPSQPANGQPAPRSPRRAIPRSSR